MKLLHQLFLLLLLIATCAFAQTNLLTTNTTPANNPGQPATDITEPPNSLQSTVTNLLGNSQTSTKTSSIRKQGLELLRNHDFKAAHKIFSDLYAKNTNDFRSLFTVGTCRFYLEDFEGAANAYSNFVVIRPKEFLGHEWLGRSLYNQRKFSDAEREFSKAVQLQPTNAEPYDFLGYCLECREEYAKAASAYEQAIRLGGYTAYRCERAGLIYFHFTNYDCAIKLFNRAIPLDATNSFPHEWLGKCLYELRKFDDAEREFNTAVQLQPTNAEPYDYLGYCLENHEQYAKAATAYEQAVRLGGDTSYRCEHAGANYVRSTNYDRAITLLCRAIPLNPTNYFAYEWLGLAYYRSGRYEPAATNFEKSLRCETNRPYTHSWLGYSYNKLKNYNRAADEFRTQLQIEPDDSYTRKLCASSLLQAHRESECIKVLEPYVPKNPTDNSAKLTLFTAYLMHRDYQKAAKLYPVTFTVSAILLAVAFLVGSVVLLRKSFRPSTSEHPHLAFAISWIVLFFEAQIALVFYAGLFTSDKMIAGLLLAPIPLLFAAFHGFPHQPWGKPFRPPEALPWKQIVIAAGVWIGIVFIGGIYMLLVKSITHSEPEPRNVRFVLEIVREHRALAALVVVILGPISEEILFRGLLFGALQKWFRPMWTIIITAALFAMIHLDLYYFLPLFLLGLLLGWARYTSNSIWFSTAIHIFQNALAFTALSLK